MKDKEIQQLLLTHYLFAIEMVRGKRYMEARKIVIDMKVFAGVCLCADHVFNVWLFNGVSWVNQYKNRRAYWHSLPIEALYTSQIIDCLQARVNILQKILHP